MMPTQEQINDLEKTLALIEHAAKQPVLVNENPVRWGQSEWIIRLDIDTPRLEEGACGTAACLCGARALMDGAEVRGKNAVRMDDGTVLVSAEQWQEWGAARFGLDAVSADHLFYFENTMPLMRHYVDRIKAGDLPLTKTYPWDLDGSDR